MKTKHFLSYFSLSFEPIFLFSDENVVPGDIKDKKEVEMEDPVCVTLEYYR